MQIAIIGQKEAADAIKKLCKNENLVFFSFPDIHALTSNFAVIFDFSFELHQSHIEKLRVTNACVFVNSVCYTLKNIEAGFVRFNGWHSFIERNVLEIATNENTNPAYKDLLTAMQLSFIAVPDIIGLVSPRIISMIINEAYFALEENVSTKEEIDIAMQLGTNYPFGPFTWSEKIGLKNIANLLLKLSENDERYTVAKALQENVR